MSPSRLTDAARAVADCGPLFLATRVMFTVSPGLARARSTLWVIARVVGRTSAKLKPVLAEAVLVRSMPVKAPVAVEAAAGVPLISVPRTKPVLGVSAIE